MRHTARARRHDRELRGAHPARRRRVPLVELPRHRQRRVLRRRAVPRARTRTCRPSRVRTNNPPCGAMRGFGVVQSCFAHEAQMDRLADACGLDPVELRLRNALAPGDELLTGQRIDGALPVRRGDPRVRGAAAARARGRRRARPPGWRGPHRATRSTCGAASGFAVGFKNLMYAEGYMDGSVARCRIDDGVVTITCAAAEVGQGFVTLVQQIARTVLGVDDVIVAPADTSIGSAGSTSASRQTMMSGGAVEQACRRGARRARTRAPAGRTPVDARLRRSPRREPDRRHRGVPPPAHASARRRRPGRRPRVVRVRRAPRGRRRRPRARARARRAPRDRAGRRPGAQPAAGDRARSKAASRRASGWR